MFESGVRYKNACTGGWIERLETGPELMLFERAYAGGTGHADPHLHLDFTQTWEAIGGEGMIEVDGEKRRFAEGDWVRIAPGITHRDPYDPADGGLRVVGGFDPCPQFIYAFAEAWAHHMRAGTVDKQDQIPLLRSCSHRLMMGAATAPASRCGFRRRHCR